MSTRRKMINDATRHQIYLQRYAGSHTKQLLSYINKLESSIKELIPNTENALTKVRYVKLVKNFKALADSLNKDMQKKMLNDLSNLVKYEADFTKRVIDSSVNVDKVPFETTVPPIAQLQSAAFTSVMDFAVGASDSTVGASLEQYGKNIAANIVQTVRQGYAVGDTTANISKAISDYVGQGIVKQQATAITRTITNHLASTAREEVYKENSDIVTGYQVVATLDSRTTLTCMSLDGEVFDVNSFNKPPYHWNCRSTYIGVIDSKYSISFPGSTRPAKNEDGNTSAKGGSTYNSWLRTQSEGFQDDVLGVERAKLFREGASVQSFVDHNYAPITLEELEAKDIEHN